MLTCALRWRAGALGLALIALVPVGTAEATENACAKTGIAAFRAGGTDAALTAFRKALRRPECAEDAQLQLNYARALLSASEEHDVRSCVAAEYFQRAASALSGALKTLAQEDAVAAEALCGKFNARAGTTEIVMSKGHGAERSGELVRASIFFRIATRLEPDSKAPYAALCALLPRLNQAGEARAHCQTARTLHEERIYEREYVLAPSGRRRTTEWVLTGSAAALLVAGGISFGQATAAADEAWGAQNEARAAASSGNDIGLQGALKDRDEANESARNLQFVSWGLVGIGTALGVAAVVGWVSDDDGPSVRLGPNHVDIAFAW